MNDGVTIVKAINQRIEKNSFRIPGGVEAINKYFFVTNKNLFHDRIIIEEVLSTIVLVVVLAVGTYVDVVLRILAMVS